MGAAVGGMLLGKGLDEGLGAYKSSLAWSRLKRTMTRRHQWEVNDLRKAGLNPILSAGGAPSIGGPQQQPPSSFGDIGELVRKSKDSKSGRKTARVTRQQVAAARDLAISGVAVNNAAARQSDSKSAQNEAQTYLLNMQRPGAQVRAAAWAQAGQAAKSLAPFMRSVQGIGETLGEAWDDSFPAGGGAKTTEEKRKRRMKLLNINEEWQEKE